MLEKIKAAARVTRRAVMAFVVALLGKLIFIGILIGIFKVCLWILDIFT